MPSLIEKLILLFCVKFRNSYCVFGFKYGRLVLEFYSRFERNMSARKKFGAPTRRGFASSNFSGKRATGLHFDGR